MNFGSRDSSSSSILKKEENFQDFLRIKNIYLSNIYVIYLNFVRPFVYLVTTLRPKNVMVLLVKLFDPLHFVVIPLTYVRACVRPSVCACDLEIIISSFDYNGIIFTQPAIARFAS